MDDEAAAFMNFVVIDRRTAWSIFELAPPEGYEIIDREEGYERQHGHKIDYRKVIFKVDGKVYLLTAAAYPQGDERGLSFFLYGEERWSDDERESVSCPEMIVES